MIIQFRKTIVLSVKQNGRFHTRTFVQQERIEAQIVPLTARHIVVRYSDGELNIVNDLIAIVI